MGKQPLKYIKTLGNHLLPSESPAIQLYTIGEPIVQDRGITGLEQSLYHSLAGLSQYNIEGLKNSSEVLAIYWGDTGEVTESLEQRLLAYVLPSDREIAASLLRTIIDITVMYTIAISLTPLQTPLSDNEPVTISQLKIILQQTL